MQQVSFCMVVEGCGCGGLRCGVDFFRREDADVGGGKGCVWVCAHTRACSDGKSPLWIAAQGGHVSCVEALIRLKADVLQCNK
jgi:hypothetical protein